MDKDFSRDDSSSALVVREDLEKLRSKIVVKDTILRTRKKLEADILERKASINSWNGQIKTLEGMIDLKTEELKILEERLAQLQGLKD